MPYNLERWRRWLEAPTPAGPLEESLEGFFGENYAPEARVGALRRYQALTEAFASRLGAPELSIARAPGRINLIGEHTDYNGLPVLPMAIDRDIAALFVPGEDATVHLTNMDPAFPDRTFSLRGRIAPYPPGDWGNYCKAACQELIAAVIQRGADPSGLRGFRAVVDGNIPSAAGMSSSSALVVVCALMFLKVNSSEINRLELAELLAEAEKYVGTQGGGMDQAISLMGRSASALKIDFFPLVIEPVDLPRECLFVVANSLVRADKGAGAQDLYNRRPVECRLAAALLRGSLESRFGREIALLRLGDLREDRLAAPQEEIDRIAGSALHPHSYTLREIAGLLGLSPEETANAYCRRRDGSIFPEPTDGFKLHPRFRHVTEEGRRVQEAAVALRDGKNRHFGELMNASHASCRDLFEISCPELDRLVEIARAHGALGARLTGAGFGGCAVCLVDEAALPRFLAGVRRDYYGGALGLTHEEPPDVLFACRAVPGAQTLPA